MDNNSGGTPQPTQPNFANQPIQFASSNMTAPVFNAGNALPKQPTTNGNNPTAAAVTNTDKPSRVVLIVAIVSTLAAITFIGLFIWMFVRWNDVQTDVNGQIQEAVALAVDENTVKLEEDFAEREKSPYKTFAGPADYGELSFEYPKTWSLYIAADAANGGNYQAYFNPVAVNPINKNSINALRVTIYDQSYDSISSNYERSVKDGKLSISVRQIGGSNANVYTGLLENNLQGMFALIKIRDKAAVIQTDAMIFQEDFNRLLDTVKYNS